MLHDVNRESQRDDGVSAIAIRMIEDELFYEMDIRDGPSA